MTTMDQVNQSISNMSSDELLNRIRELRTARRVPTAIPRHAKKNKNQTKDAAKLLNKMTPQQIAQLIKQLEEG